MPPKNLQHVQVFRTNLSLLLRRFLSSEEGNTCKQRVAAFLNSSRGGLAWFGVKRATQERLYGSAVGPS